MNGTVPAPGRTTDYDVAIVGYGPTGAVLANILGAAGINTVVYERDAAPMNIPRAVHFDGEVMRVFQALGLADEVSSQIRRSTGVQYYSAAGQLLMERRPPGQTGQHIWSDKNMFHQPDLEAVLRQGTQRYPNVDVRLQHDVTAVTQTADSVSIDAHNLATGEHATTTARYAIGSDGGRSLFRRIMGTQLEDFDVHDPWLVVDVELLTEVDLPDCTVQYCDPARPTTYVHVTGNRRRWEFKILPDDVPKELTQEDSIWELLRNWVQPTQARLVRHAIYTFHALVAEQWQQGRLFLAGDSAHQTPPFLGQGMCAGVRDASNLGWKLVRVCHGADPALLNTYETERRPHVIEFVKTAVELGKIIQTTDPVQAEERNRRMLAGTAIDFRDPQPPLGPGAHTSEGHGGRIVGQPTLASGVPLDDHVGNRIAVITKNSPEFTTVRDRTSDTTHDLTWVADDALDTWLTQQQVEALILRPDRYVLGSANNATELTELLTLVTESTGTPEGSPPRSP